MVAGTCTLGCTCLFATMERGGADKESKSYIHTCVNACTHSYQGVRPDEGLLVHTCLHVTM